jgi:hypothetical protein
MADIAAGGRLPVPSVKVAYDALVVAVVATLVVYCLAEEYADLLGEQVESGSVPTWNFIRGRLDATWPMVSASYLPLLALVHHLDHGRPGPGHDPAQRRDPHPRALRFVPGRSFGPANDHELLARLNSWCTGLPGSGWSSWFRPRNRRPGVADTGSSSTRT